MTGFFSKFINKLKGQSQGGPESQASQPDSGPPSSAPQSLSSPATPDTPQAPPKKSSTGTTMATVWKARPIFFSSTFKDMHTERDYLRDHAFPRLAERLRERCHYLDTIDLRQGVENAHLADEGEREMQVLRVCLDEIERSRPFLVALLGDRYGWIPPAERISAAARAAGLPDSVEVAGKSVTELEILYGVLENTDQARRSWFYFRTLDRASMPPEMAARFPEEEPSTDADAPAAKLQALKDRIRQQLPDRVREYHLRWDDQQQALVGLDELDAQVEQDLWSDLDTETAAYLREAPSTWQEADARAVSDFVAERIRGSIERPAMTRPMLEHALAPAAPGADWGLVVTGESGSGKSSLFGVALRALQQRNAADEILLLSHAAGIFPLSGQVDRMLRRWIGDLAQFLGVEDPIAAQEEASLAAASADQTRPGETKIITSEEIETTFTSLLGRAAGTVRVVILIDALNQFEPTTRAQHLTWLPRLWPENARFLATSIPGTTSEALKKRPGCMELPVLPIRRDEAWTIAETFYRERHHRDVNPRVLDALLDKRDDERAAHSNPLWLVLALQEMNLLEADDFERADRDFSHLPGAKRMEALQLAEAAQIPGDVPGAYGELLDRAERLHGVVWVRYLTSLLALGRAGWREIDLQMLMPMESGMAWDPLLFAGLRRTLSSHLVQRGAHGQWDYFHTTLRQTILTRNLTDNAINRLLHGLLADHLQGLLPTDPLRISETMVHLVGLNDQDRAADFLSILYSSQWDRIEAKAALSEAITVLVEAVLSATDNNDMSSITDWIIGLLEGPDAMRTDYIAAFLTNHLNEALEIPGIQVTELARGRIMESVRHVLEVLYSGNPSDANARRLSVLLERLGAYYRGRNESGYAEKAIECYRLALDIDQLLADRNPNDETALRDLSLTLGRIGSFYFRRAQSGDIKLALDAYQRSHNITERLYEANQNKIGAASDYANSLRKLGDYYLRLNSGERSGDERALEFYKRSLEICQHLHNTNPNDEKYAKDLAFSLLKIGDYCCLYHFKSSNKDQGVEAYERSLKIVQRIYDASPDDAEKANSLAASLHRLGNIYLDRWAMGDADRIMEINQRSLAITQHLYEINHSNAQAARNLAVALNAIGDFHLKCQKNESIDRALDAYQRSLKLVQRLHEVDPDDGLSARDLAMVLDRLANCYDQRGENADVGKALTSGQRSVEILQRLYDANLNDRQAASDLARSLTRLSGYYLKHREGYRVDKQILDVCQRALEINQYLFDSDPQNIQAALGLSIELRYIGNYYLYPGESRDMDRALDFFQRALEINQHLFDGDPQNSLADRNLLGSFEMLGDFSMEHGACGDTDRALVAYQRSLEINQRLSDANPLDTKLKDNLAGILHKLGDWYQRTRGNCDVSKAIKAYQNSLEIYQHLYDINPQDAHSERCLSTLYGKIGDSYRSRNGNGDAGRAMDACQHSLEIAQRRHKVNPADAQAAQDLSVSLAKLGDLYLHYSDNLGITHALNLYQLSFQTLQRLFDVNPKDAVTVRELSVSLERLGICYLNRGKEGDAERVLDVFQRSLELRQVLLNNNPKNGQAVKDLAFSHGNIATILHQNGHNVDALKHYRLCATLLERLDVANNEAVRNSLQQTKQTIATLESIKYG